MGAFGCLLLLTSQGVLDEASVRRFTANLERKVNDGSGVHREKRLAFIHHAFHTTPESYDEVQPSVSNDLVVLLDGRIDNREELRTELHKSHRPISDVELVRDAYLSWEKDCFAKLIGDFAISIWDKRQKQLILARDPFGIRKLFTTEVNDLLLWSTDLGALLDFPGVDLCLNDAYIGMALADLPEGHLSPYKNIAPIIPGTYVVVSDRQVAIRRFWGIDSIKTDSTPRRERVNKCRDLLEKAVSASLRSDRAVTAELSGGLDSSTIVCVAHTLRRRNAELSSVPLHTMSFVYDTSTTADESKFIRIIEEAVQLPAVHLQADQRPAFSEWPDPHFRSYPNRLHCFGGALDQRMDSMVQRNSRVLLSGLFGDQLFISYEGLPYGAADCVATGALIEAIKKCYRWSLKTRMPFTSVFWHSAIRPQLPAWMLRMPFQSGREPAISPIHFRVPSWINPTFANKIDLHKRIMKSATRGAGLRSGSTGLRFANTMECVGWFGSGYCENDHSSKRIEMRYPLTYRPLVEFALSLPFEEHCDEEGTRILHRRAVEGWVPDAIRRRVIKRGPMESVLRGFKKEWSQIEAIIAHSIAAERGYVLKDKLRAEAKHWLAGSINSDLLKFFSVEMWLRRLDGR